jgi:hypothetical protein
MKIHLPITKIVAFGILLFASHTGNAFGDDPAPFSTVTEQRQTINSKFEYIEDPSGSLTYQEIAEGKAGRFKPLTLKNWGFGFRKVLWIRFSLDFANYQSPYWFLTQNYEHVGELTLFYPAVAGYEQLQMLEREPSSKRPFLIHNYLFKVPLPPTQTATYYMRFNPQGHVLTVDLSSSGLKGIIEFLHNAQFNLGLFFGGLLAIWLYNFILFVRLAPEIIFTIFITSAASLQRRYI